MLSNTRASKACLLPLVLLALGISVLAPEQANATTPCLYDLDRNWVVASNIYTGKVVAVTYPPEGEQDATVPEGSNPESNVRIDFELEHILKGYPQHTSWKYHVPLESYCPANFCVAGADHYTPDSEVFYITDSEGRIIQSGACAIGSAKVHDGDHWTLPDEFFDHFKSIYGFDPPRDRPCPDADHVLVLLDGENFACVDPSTAEAKNWDAFNMKKYQSNPSNERVAYDYPLSSKYTESVDREVIAEIEVVLSSLPKIGETADITIKHAHPHEYNKITPNDLKKIKISSNFEFVGLDEEKIETSASGGIVYSYSYSEAFAPLTQSQTDTMSVKIKAVSEGLASITGRSQYGVAGFTVVVGDDQTLLVRDHIRTSNPMPDMSVILSPQQAAGFKADTKSIPTPLESQAVQGRDQLGFKADTKSIPTPLLQVRAGVPLDETVCADGHILMASPSGSPACTFAGSASPLEQRGFVLVTANPT